jgi:hypothetical protein
MSESVGRGGKNNTEDVQLIKTTLKELGYPIKDENGPISDGDIKAIMYFQNLYADVKTSETNSNPKAVTLPDGLISKGGFAEATLFGKNPKKYEEPTNGTIKPISQDCQDAKTEAKDDTKKRWDKIIDVWNTISPYLPDGSKMTSGYRSSDEQRLIIYNFYNVKYKDQIQKKNSEATWAKYKELQGKNNTDAENQMLTMVRACGQKVEAPGSSPHQKGIAIDVGGMGDEKQCRALLWCYVNFIDKALVTKILPEVNGCVHFKFKP